MLSRKNVVRLSSVVVLATLVAALFWMSGFDGFRQAVPAEASTAPPSESEPAAVTAPEVQPTTATTSVSVPMPSPQLPIRDAFASLRARAEGGDSLAACRLGVELMNCQRLDAFGPDYDDWLARGERQAEREGNLELANEFAIARLSRAELRQGCAGLPESLLSEANHYLRQAALAGQPEAMIRYAAGESLMAGHLSYRFIATPAFDVWRREAHPLLMRALERGVPEAALLLAETHSANAGLLAMLVPPDPVEAHASQMLVRQLFGDDPALGPLEPLARIDGDPRAEAEAFADRWHSEAFDGRQLSLEDSTAALLTRHGWQYPGVGSPRWPGSPPDFACARDAEESP